MAGIAGTGRRGQTHAGRRAAARALAAAAVILGVPDAPTAARSPADEPAPQVASRHTTSAAPATRPGPRVSAHSRSPVVDTTLADPVVAAKRAMALCQIRFGEVEDYTCTFTKRERIDGKLGEPHVMVMKARSSPRSIYFRFVKPKKGREAIYVAGRHKGHVLAHDVGLFKVIAGSMLLDPAGETAMEGCRHPITEAGIGSLIDTVTREWERELTPDESRVEIDPDLMIGTRRCTLIETVHPGRRSDFLFHKVRLYIDHDLGLPVRFEAYDWPARSGAAPPLVEEYAYTDLKVNVGLSDHDFDPNNRSYSFGRF